MENLAKLMGSHIAVITSFEHLTLGLQTPKTSVVYMQECFKLYPLSSNSLVWSLKHNPWGKFPTSFKETLTILGHLAAVERLWEEFIKNRFIYVLTVVIFYYSESKWATASV